LLVKMIIILLLFLLWAYFAGSETAFVSTNRFKLYNLKKKGGKNARLAYYLLEKPDRLLSTSLVGANLSLVLSANLIARGFYDIFGQPKPVISVITITILSLIFCEVLPKSLALKESLRWTLLSSIPMFAFYIVFYPVSKIFSFLTKIIMRVTGISPSGFSPGLSGGKEDVQFFLSAHLKAQFSKDERRYFLDSMDIVDKKLSDIITPLVDIHALPDTAKIKNCYEFTREFNEGYIPIYHRRIDNIIGIIDINDLFDKDKNLPVVDIFREPVYIPENKSISQLYRDSYEKKFRAVFAVDEYGGVTGMATIYDIGEEIIGKISTVEEKSLIFKIKDGEYLCAGDAEIDEINNLLSIEIEQEGFSTVNGLILKGLGKIPEKGDYIFIHGCRFTVEKSSKKRAELIRIEKVA